MLCLILQDGRIVVVALTGPGDVYRSLLRGYKRIHQFEKLAPFPIQTSGLLFSLDFLLFLFLVRPTDLNAIDRRRPPSSLVFFAPHSERILMSVRLSVRGIF